MSIPPHRSDSTLRPPESARNYVGFPTDVISEGARWYRCHGPHSPWYYSSQDGRFNLPEPRGTLNLGSTAKVAVREFLGHRMVGESHIPPDRLVGQRVSELGVPGGRVADFTAEAALAHGIAAGDVSGPMEGYLITRAWARTLDAAGFDGIVSRSRFGAGSNPRCLYLFGPAGQHVSGTIHDEITMRAVVESMPGYTIDPVPASGGVVVDP